MIKKAKENIDSIKKEIMSEIKKEDKKTSNITSPIKLKLLFVIVNREKTDYYIDLLEGFETNLQLEVYAKGTASKSTLAMLGLEDNEKTVIMSVVKDTQIKPIMHILEDKFSKIKNGKGIAFTVPFKSIIGVYLYTYLTNQKGSL